MSGPQPRVAVLLCACSVLLSAGCATEDDRTHRFEDGWRIARVDAMGPNLPSLPVAQDCRASMTPELQQAAGWAEVWFTEDRRLRHRIVPIAADAPAPRLDATVYINVRRCLALEPRRS